MKVSERMAPLLTQVLSSNEREQQIFSNMKKAAEVINSVDLPIINNAGFTKLNRGWVLIASIFFESDKSPPLPDTLLF
jgi:hypothetical protein